MSLRLLLLTKKDLWDKLVCREEILALHFSTVKEEVDNCDDDWRRLIRVPDIVCVPLYEDQHVHVAENWE